MCLKYYSHSAQVWCSVTVLIQHDWIGSMPCNSEVNSLSSNIITSMKKVRILKRNGWGTKWLHVTDYIVGTEESDFETKSWAISNQSHKVLSAKFVKPHQWRFCPWPVHFQWLLCSNNRHLRWKKVWHVVPDIAVRSGCSKKWLWSEAEENADEVEAPWACQKN